MRLPKVVVDIIFEYVLSPKLKRKMFLAGITQIRWNSPKQSQQHSVMERVCYITQAQCIFHYGYAIQCIPKSLSAKTMGCMRALCDELHHLFKYARNFKLYSPGAISYYLMRCARSDKFIMPDLDQSLNVFSIVPKRFWQNFRERN